MLKAIRQFFSWITLLTMLPIVVAVLCSGYITYRYNLVLTETREQVRHSLDVTTAIDDLMLDLQDLETGQRGYLITGDQAYLEPFEAARRRFGADLDALRTLVPDNPAQVASLDTIAGLAESKLDELRQTIDIRRDDGFAAARAIVEKNSGKATMDAIRREVDAMRAHESDLLNANTSRMRGTEGQIVLIVAVTIALSLIGRLVGLFLAGWLRARQEQPRNPAA